MLFNEYRVFPATNQRDKHTPNKLGLFMLESIIYGLTVGFVVSFVITVIFRLLRGTTHKLCPACRGSIPWDATKCYHCGEVVELASNSTELAKLAGDTAKPSRGFWIVIAAVIAFFAFITLVASWLLP